MSEQQECEIREAFERFFLWSRNDKGVKAREQLFARREDGTYVQEHTQRHWWTWQNTRSQQQGWQPISEAPKDGRKLILSYRNRNGKARTVMGRWLTDEKAAETDVYGVGLEGGWYECIDNWHDYTEVAIHEGEPTHWQPLPAPPSVSKGGKC